MTESKFIIQYYCPDCTKIDPMGCHEGEFWYETDENDNLKLFDTPIEAEKIGETETNDSIHRFNVIPA